MKINEILTLSHSEQKNWLSENISDFDGIPFSGEPVGYIIHCDDDRLKDHINYPEDYETGSMIKSVFSKLSTTREKEINAGAKITPEEKKYLKIAVVEELSEDEFEGDNYTVCKIELQDGNVFVTFLAHLVPHPSWSFANIYETEEKAIEAIKTLTEDEYFFPI